MININKECQTSTSPEVKPEVWGNIYTDETGKYYLKQSSYKSEVEAKESIARFSSCPYVKTIRLDND